MSPEQFSVVEIFRDGTVRATGESGERYFGLCVQIGATPSLYLCERHWDGLNEPSLDWLVENSLADAIPVGGI